MGHTGWMAHRASRLRAWLTYLLLFAIIKLKKKRVQSIRHKRVRRGDNGKNRVLCVQSHVAGAGLDRGGGVA